MGIYYLDSYTDQRVAETKQLAKERVADYKQRHLPTATPTVIRDLEQALQVAEQAD